jgi:chromosomal replication initiation ATPase DnaA
VPNSSAANTVITVDGVIKAVASYYGLKPSDIKSERRHKSVATPRAVAMYISRHHTKDSYPDLARAFGGKHHTSWGWLADPPPGIPLRAHQCGLRNLPTSS